MEFDNLEFKGKEEKDDSIDAGRNRQRNEQVKQFSQKCKHHNDQKLKYEFHCNTTEQPAKIAIFGKIPASFVQSREKYLQKSLADSPDGIFAGSRALVLALGRVEACVPRSDNQ